MADLIDREALMRELGVAKDCDDCQYNDTDSFFGNALGLCKKTSDFVDACEAIAEAPSAEPKWIPVTERLPEKNGRYLTTCLEYGAWVVDWNRWMAKSKTGWLMKQGVIAWMPLPEPYGGEE